MPTIICVHVPCNNVCSTLKMKLFTLNKNHIALRMLATVHLFLLLIQLVSVVCI